VARRAGRVESIVVHPPTKREQKHHFPGLGVDDQTSHEKRIKEEIAGVIDGPAAQKKSDRATSEEATGPDLNWGHWILAVD